MTNIDGAWNIRITEPTGQKRGTLTLETSADGFTGSLVGSGEILQVTDGSINGDTLAWSMRITKPIPLTLKVVARIEADSMFGAVSVGTLGSFPMTGTRA